MLKAIQKFHRIIGTKPNAINLEIITNKTEEYIYVKEGKRTVKITLQDILYIESMKDYIGKNVD